MIAARKLFAGFPAGFDVLGDFRAGLRLKIVEGDVFQFSANFPHSQPQGDGRVDFQGLSRDALLPIGIEVAEGSHVVQAVGELHQNDPHVLDHGQQHLAKIFGLTLFQGIVVKPAQFRDPVHAAADFLAEPLLDFGDAHPGVFGDVVQQPGCNAHQIEAHVGQQVRYLYGVGEVGFTRLAFLFLVPVGGELEGVAQDGQIVGTPRVANLFF